MKKFYLGLLMLLTAVCSYAFDQDNVTLTVYSSYEDEEFDGEIKLTEINPGGEAYVVCTLDNQSDSTYHAFELLVTLPDGFELVQIYDEDEEEYFNTRPLNELSRSARWTLKDNYTKSSNTLKLVLFTANPDKYEFPAKSGKYAGQELFYFKLKATGTAVPSFAPLSVTKAIFSKSVFTGEVDEDDKPIVVNEGHYFPNFFILDYRMSQVGYSTFCYNDGSIDFSEGPLKANIAKNGHNGYAYLTPIDIVPAGTPVVLTGEAGSYMLSAKYGEFDADPSIEGNELHGTGNAALTVEGTNTFALASKTEGVGFYRCAEGVVIPRYKAYMESSAAAESMLFEETTGIQQVKTNVANNDVFTISGVKVNDTQRKGIYVTNGKKVVVK